MINVSPAFLQEMHQNDNRRFTYSIDVAFADGTTDTLTNEDLYVGGVSIEDSVSEDEKLEIGTAVINQCTVILNNFDEHWNSFDFADAELTIHISLDINGTTETFQKGIFTVTEQKYDSSLLTLTGMDRMSQFERDYVSSTTLKYPTTLGVIVRNTCSVCGVPLATPDFPNSSVIIPTKPPKGTTCRSVISWAAMCCGCNARVNRFGQLEIGYYDFDYLSAFDTTQLDDWTNASYLLTESGDNLVAENGDKLLLDNARLNVFRSLYTIDTAINDTTITGVKAVVENPSASDTSNAFLEYTYGTDGYMIVLESNSFITKANAQKIVNSIGPRLVGASYRKASFSHLSDPLAEAGDVAVIFDGKGRAYRVLISSTTFTANDRQTSVSAGENPPRVVTSTPANRSVGAATPQIITGQNAQRLSAQAASFINTIKVTQGMGGLYNTEIVEESGATIHYLHNKRELEESDIQIVISSDGIQVTANALGENPNWYGMTVDGNLIANILSATGVNADWINTGALVITDDEDFEIFRADKTNHEFSWSMSNSQLLPNGRLLLYDDDETLWEGASLSVENLDGGEQSYVLSRGFQTEDMEDISSSQYRSWHSVVEPHQIYIIDFSTTNGVVDRGSKTTIFNITGANVVDDEPVATGMTVQGISLEEWIQRIAAETTSTSVTLTKPSSLTNFTFGTIWQCRARRKNGMVTLHFNFDGYFTSTGTTGGTVFTLPSGYRPPDNMYLNRVNQGGVRYLLSLNTNGNVTLQNVSGEAGTTAQFFRDVITFPNS